jgi:hypothetical protein
MRGCSYARQAPGTSRILSVRVSNASSRGPTAVRPIKGDGTSLSIRFCGRKHATFRGNRDIVFPLTLASYSGLKPNRRPNPKWEESAGPILQPSSGLSLSYHSVLRTASGDGTVIGQTIAIILQNVSVDTGRVTGSDYARRRQPGFQAEKTIEIRVLALYCTYKGQFEIENMG